MNQSNGRAPNTCQTLIRVLIEHALRVARRGVNFMKEHRTLLFDIFINFRKLRKSLRGGFSRLITLYYQFSYSIVCQLQVRQRRSDIYISFSFASLFVHSMYMYNGPICTIAPLADALSLFTSIIKLSWGVVDADKLKKKKKLIVERCLVKKMEFVIFFDHNCFNFCRTSPKLSAKL